jgi:lipid-binding SYLF domain-containing protein
MSGENHAMNALTKIASGLLLAFGLFAATGAQARPQSVLAHATATVEDLKHDRMFGDARNALRHARAVLIVPQLVKGGFIFGAEGGDGVLLARTGRGFSSPAFYSLTSGSFGLQIGLEEAQLVMFIMSDKALRAVERSKFKIGAGAGLTVVTLGAGAEGATSGNFTGDIVVWSRAKGAYGGITLNGSVVAPEEDTNADFYGSRASVPEILDNKVSNPAANALRAALKSAL